MGFLDKLTKNVDRRKKDRRSKDQTDDCPIDVEDRRSEKDRRESQRRKLFRVLYPFGAAPVVLNNKISILDISIESIRFVFENKNESIPIGEILELEMKFQDDEIITRKIIVKNCYDESLGKNQYIGHFTKPLPSNRMGKEQAYVLRSFPDFCREISELQKNYALEVEKRLEEERFRQERQESQDSVDSHKDKDTKG